MNQETFNSLTVRERQVAKRVVRGWENTVIGEALGISPRTVEEHRAKVFRKFGVHGAIELVRAWYDLDAIDDQERTADDPRFDAVVQRSARL